MGRPRIPLNIIKMRGGDKHDPARFKDRQNEMQPESLGRVPTNLEPEYKSIWKEIVGALPDNTIGKTDRIALETLCKLTHQMRTDFENMDTAKLTRLETLLGKFCMTPSDRSKITVPPKKEHSAWDDI